MLSGPEVDVIGDDAPKFSSLTFSEVTLFNKRSDLCSDHFHQPLFREDTGIARFRHAKGQIKELRLRYEYVPSGSYDPY